MGETKSCREFTFILCPADNNPLRHANDEDDAVPWWQGIEMFAHAQEWKKYGF
jgi:hypothetical protein